MRFTNEMVRRAMRLYAVTDRAWIGRQSLYEQVEAALRGGATCVQLREKKLCDEELLKEARLLRELCSAYQVPLFINDRVDIALACGADGVHVGQEDLPVSRVREMVGPDMLIGASAHSVEEAREAVLQGANCLGAGAMFATSTKKNVTPMPIETLRAICQNVPVPVVAIGGIQRSNLPLLRGTGVAGVALVSAIFGAEDIEGECQLLLKLSQEVGEW